MKGINNKLTWFLLIVIILLNAVVINFLLSSQNVIHSQLDSVIDNKISEFADHHNLVGVDGKTPVKGIDYFDGKDGAKGEKGEAGVNGAEGKQGEKGDTGEKGENGTDGVDGKTPQIRCNVNKNVWQVRYSDDDLWQDMNGQKVACTTAPKL